MNTRNRFLVAFVAFALLIFVVVLSTRAEVIAASEIHVLPGQSIQEAINNAANGDTIVVQNGMHLEVRYPIVVNRSITLTGQNVAETVVNGNGSSVGILLVKVDNVRIFNLTIQNTTAENFATGINLFNVRFAEVAGCILANCGSGLGMTNSSESNVTRNSIVNNKSFGVYLHSASSFNVIWDNNVTGNPTGIQFADTSCQHNVFYHNNFVANTNHQSGLGMATSWDDDYPSGGNYWDDHTNEDLLNGVGQNLTGSDGIADVSYRDLDLYPLAEPVYTFFMYGLDQSDYYVLISSNSTVYDFSFSPSAGSFVVFKATGSDGTVGCCRVIVPKSILWVGNSETWTITVNGTTLAMSPLIDEGQFSTFFYFAYSHSTDIIVVTGTHVVPEYSLLAFLWFLAFLTGGFAFVVKRRRELG